MDRQTFLRRSLASRSAGRYFRGQSRGDGTSPQKALMKRASALFLGADLSPTTDRHCRRAVTVVSLIQIRLCNGVFVCLFIVH